MSIKKELITHQTPKSPLSEAFRTLRTNIQFMNTSQKIKTLLVTSTLPGEGKSWISSNLAVTFAQTGNKVLLIDADMRKGRQYTIFGISPIPGLSNCLATMDMKQKENIEITKYVQKTEIDNLFVITAGNIPPNPSELLVAPQMQFMLEKLKEEYDFIIIDGTPSELVTDSIILTRIVDTTLIVTSYKETKKDKLERVIKKIKNVGGNIVGVTINKVPNSSKNNQYYYENEIRK